MATKKIGIVLAADGEKEFNAAMSNATNSVRSNQAAMKKLAEEYSNSQNSLEFLRKKNALLADAVQKADEKVRRAAEGLKNARDNQEKATRRLAELEQEYKRAADAQQRFADSGDTSSKAYKESAKIAEQYATAIEKQKLEITKTEGKIDSWKGKITNAEAAYIKANKALDDNKRYLEEAENSTDKCAKSIDEFGKKVKNSAGDIQEFGRAVCGIQEVTTGLGEKIGQAFVTKGVDIAVDALKNGAAAVADTMQDISAATADLQAKTGLSTAATEKYKSVMQQVRGENFGEDYRDISDTMAEIVQIMGELDGSAMKDITEGAITLRDTFDMDVNETIRATDSMMKTMGVSATEAFDLIAKGAQNGLNRSGELTDNLTEYSQLWGQAGFSAQEMFAILENGLNSGAYNLDKVNDYVKEFGISLSDGRMEKNISSFSDETKRMFELWQSGGASTRDVFYQVISDLEGMEDQQKALTIASDTWSALGEDNAMQVLTALNDVNDAYKDIGGTMQELQNTKYSDLGSSLQQLGATISQDIVTPLADKALPLLQAAVDGANDALKGAFEQPKSELQILVDDIESAHDKARSMAESASSGYSVKTEEITRIQALSEQLITLNGIENKNEIQKRNLKAVVDELGKSIPELAAAYDEQRGAVNLTDTEIKNLTGSTIELMKAQAAQAAMQETVNAQVEAEIALKKAQDNATAMQDKADMYRQEMELINELMGDLAGLEEQKNQAMASGMDVSGIDSDIAGIQDRYNQFWNEMKEKGIVSVDEYNAAISNMAGVTSGELSRLYGIASTNADNWQAEADSATEKTSEYENEVKKLGEETERYSKYADEAVDSLFEQKAEVENNKNGVLELRDALKNGAEATDESTASFLRNKDASGEMAEADEEAADSAEEAAERRKKAAEAVEEAQKSSLENIRDAYEQTRQSIENDLQNGISFTKLFEGGDDVTTEEINAALESQLAGYKNYAENLEKIRSMTDESGRKIFSDETIRYIESQGTGFANVLEHICWTYQNQGQYGLQQVEGINQKFVDMLDLSESIATSTAANQTAIQAAFGELGSTEIEFSELRDNIDSAIENDLDGWGDGLSQSLADELYTAIDNAQAMGVKIPEGLAEGIRNGETTPREAIDQISAAMQGNFAGLEEVAKNAGIEVPGYIRDGIAAGGDDMVQAFNDLIGLITGSDVYSDMETKGSEIGDGTKSGIEGKRDAVKTAAEGNANAAANAVGNASNQFTSAGRKNMDAYEKAILSKRSSTTAAARAVSTAAATAVNGTYNQFRNAGLYVSQGIAAGIRSGSYGVQLATIAVARAALNSFNNALGIHSPSTVFREAAGWIPEGVILGVEEKKSGAVTIVRDMAYSMYSQAYEWLAKIKKDQTVAIEDEAWFWRKIMDITKEGTWGHEEAMAQYYSTVGGLPIAMSKAIASNFDIKDVQKSWNLHSTDKSLIGQAIRETKYDYENGKRIEKSDADASADAYSRLKKMLERDDIKAAGGLSDAYKLSYWKEASKYFSQTYDEWYDIQSTIQQLENNINKATSPSAQAQATYEAAKEYLEKYQILHNVSTEEELAYWQAVRDRLTDGTDSWYDATKEIKSLQQQLIQEQEKAEQEYYSNLVGNQNNLLANWKVYYSQSARADMEYWDLCRKQLVAGTQERIDADNKYLQAKQKYYDELNALNEQYADDQKKINDDLQNSVDSLNESYQEAVDSRKKDILSGMSLFSEYDPEGESDVTALIDALQSQVDTLAFWESELLKLENRGLSDDLMETLRSMGADAAVEINALANATDEQLAAYQALYDKRNALAESQAARENENLREQSNQEIENLKAAANEQLKMLEEEYNNNLANLNSGLDEHLKAAALVLTNYNYDAAAGMINGINKAWDSSAAIAEEKSREIVKNISGQISGIEELYREIGSDALDAMLAELTNSAKIEQAASWIRATIGGETMELSASPVTVLNAASGQDVTSTVRVDNTGLADTMQGLAAGMVQGIIQAMSNMGVYIDSDTLVGKIMPAVSEQIADAVIRKSGGGF